MALQCNINSKGKAARLISGILMIFVALALVLVWAIPTGRVLPWAVVAIIFVSGAFAVFEGWAGWCVVRAMGFKTPV